MAKFTEQTLHNAITATATSLPLNLENFGGGVGFQLVASGITSGNCVFTFEGTIDGTNWVALNVLVTNVTNTNAQTPTRVASVTLNSNTSSLVFLEKAIASGLKAVRVVATITTDGTYTAKAIAKSE